jgi:hypothetical protein
MIYTIMIAFITFAIGWYKGFNMGYRKGKFHANFDNYKPEHKIYFKKVIKDER